MIQLQSNMRICIPLRVIGNPNSGCLTGVATGQCRNTIGEVECEVMTDEINRTKKWFKRSDIRPIGNTGIASIENKSQAWIDNMMAQRGSVIAPNFNSVSNTPTQNQQWNKLMIQQGLPHRVGTGNQNLETPYKSQSDCPPGATFDDGGRPQGENSAMNRCIPPTSQADCPSDSVFQDSSYPDGPKCLLIPTPQPLKKGEKCSDFGWGTQLGGPRCPIECKAGGGKIGGGRCVDKNPITKITKIGKEITAGVSSNLIMLVIIGGFVYYAYTKGLLNKTN